MTERGVFNVIKYYVLCVYPRRLNVTYRKISSAKKIRYTTLCFLWKRSTVFMAMVSIEYGLEFFLKISCFIQPNKILSEMSEQNENFFLNYAYDCSMESMFYEKKIMEILEGFVFVFLLILGVHFPVSIR